MTLCSELASEETVTRMFAALGGGAFVLACLVVGVRLLRLAWRSRALPESLMGTSLLLMGGFAYPLTSVARAAQALSDAQRTGLMIGAHVLMVVGLGAMAVFNWRVFRPASPVARGAAGALCAGLLCCFAWQGWTPGFRAGALDKEGAGLVGITVLAALTLGWAAAEALLYSARLRRRIGLGLGDPAVLRTVSLWAVSASCAAIISTSSVVLHALGIDPALSVPGALVIAPFGLVAAIAMGRAFSAPASATEPSAQTSV